VRFPQGADTQRFGRSNLKNHRQSFDIAMTKIFHALIGIRGINPFVLVSASRADAIRPGWRKPVPVLVRINGGPTRPWRTSMMPVGDGRYFLYLHGDIRKASNSTVGDRVRVEIEFDERYRGGPRHIMPRWFKRGLALNPRALENWAALVPSRRKEMLRYFSRLKTPNAWARNLAGALLVLSGENGRFMGRTWKGGT
jgi:Domain of unknown function (DUF1905)/Bacteriocin-protection, YdeI or OmpD-Associated